MRIVHDRVIEISTSSHSFVNEEVYSLFQIAVATNVLCRLGNPIMSDQVIIEIDGIFKHNRVIPHIQEIISQFMNQRTSIRLNCLCKNADIKILFTNNSHNNYEDYPHYQDKNCCVLLYSEGLDSRLASYLLKKQGFHVKHISFAEDGWEKNYIKELKSDICQNSMYLDTFDNDPWDNYGLYFVYSVLALNFALANSYGNISIGLNKDDLFGYDIISGQYLDSQCSQSSKFTEFFSSICGRYGIKYLLPLKQYSRKEICETIIRYKVNVEDSVSCVFNGKYECGMCFSCFDKLMGFLSAVEALQARDNLVFEQGADKFSIYYENALLMNFTNEISEFKSAEQLPIDTIIMIQLQRMILGEDQRSILSSKYSPKNLVEILDAYKFSEIGLSIFPRSIEFYLNNLQYFVGYKFDTNE